MSLHHLLASLQRVGQLSKQEQATVEHTLAQYPFCSLAYALQAKTTYTADNAAPTLEVQKAAVYAPSRTALKQLLAYIPQAPATRVQQVSPTDTSTALLAQQLALIDAFISAPRTRSSEPAAAIPTDDFSENSTQLHDALLTESLAQLRYQQGDSAGAKAIYDKLKLKFPEKNAYFTQLIAALKQ